MSQRPGAAPAADGGWRTTAAILSGTAVPVVVLALLSWLSAPDGTGTAGPKSAERPAPVAPRRLQAQVVATYPHDPTAFTQGLVLDDGVLYESTGLEGKSTLRRVDIPTGKILKSVPLAPDHFGEGLARTPLGLIQLTWTSQTALVYDPTTLAPRGRAAYQGEGWGLCYDGASLVMSDGTDVLTFRRPDTFAIERTVHVVRDGAAQRNLNELECVAGSVYANVWQRDFLVRIEPTTGRVLERIDAAGLLSDREREAADVLNGIAHDSADGSFYLTGKLWPKLFKVRFVPAAAAAP